jgi:hypothetical protein
MRITRTRLAVAGALVALVCTAAPTATSASTPIKHKGLTQPSPSGLSAVVLQRVGNPAWTPADWHVFSAPVGTAADGYSEFFPIVPQKILPPPHYAVYNGLGIGPGTPEKPPYTHDVGVGVRRAGYDQGALFDQKQFSNGQGVYLVYMVVPARNSRNIGSSPDFSRGPIIPNSLFPITVNGTTYRNGAVFDAALASIVVPAINQPPVDPTIAVDGFSHFPIFIAENADFGPAGIDLTGLYWFQLTMRDTSGNGWNISAYFVVG